MTQGRYPPSPGFFAALKVVQRLQSQGFTAYFAGGCVRDQLLGRPVSDFDVATSARPAEVQRLFRRTLAVGAQFGIIIVRMDGEKIEVATFRTDGEYLDGRRPETVTFSSPEEDAGRRDFTINGLFFDPLAREVLDFVGGQEDLWRGRVRAIGDPGARLDEDHLRLLRAVRFSARFGFPIEPETRKAVADRAELIREVSPERVKDELDKILAHPRRAEAIEPLLDLHLLEALDLPLYVDLEGRREETVRQLALLPGRCAAPVPWAVLLREARHADRVLRALRSSNELRERVVAILEAVTDVRSYRTRPIAARKRLLRRPHVDDLLLYAWSDALARGGDLREVEAASEELAAFGPAGDGSLVAEPLVTGHDLMTLGLKPGPQFKTLLAAAEDWQLAGELDKDALLARLREESGESLSGA